HSSATPTAEPGTCRSRTATPTPNNSASWSAPTASIGNALPSRISAELPQLARNRAQVRHPCSRKNVKAIVGARKKMNDTAWPGTAKSEPDAWGWPETTSTARNVARRIGTINNGIAIKITSGVGSRRKSRNSLRVIAKLRRSDTVTALRVVAAPREREKDTVEAGA